MSSPVIDDELLRFGRLLHYAGLAIVLVVGAVVYNLFYAPAERVMLAAEMKIDAIAVSSRNAPVIRREHERLSRQLKEIEVRYAALEARVPLNAEAGSFLKHISEIAQQEQLAISNFQPAQSVQGNGYAAMEVMLDGQGSFKSICAFFDRLSKLQRLSKVKDLTISVDPQSDVYPMKATIVIYFGLEVDSMASTDWEVGRG